MIKRAFLGLALALLAPVLAFAQTSPGLVYGQVPTAAQWNSYFAAKQDYSAAAITGPGTAVAGHLLKWGVYPAVVDGGAPPTFLQGSGITITGGPNCTAGCTFSAGAASSIAANTVWGNFTGSSAAPAAFAVPSCSTTGSALRYTSGTGFNCNTAIVAASATTASQVGGNANVAFTDQLQTFTASQRAAQQTVTISTATFTPNFNTGQDFTIGLTSACPCTIANPSTTPVAGQKGVIYVVQDATGSRTVGTWGSQYYAAGGTSGITLSTAANAIDVFSYVVKDATHVIVSLAAQNVTH